MRIIDVYDGNDIQDFTKLKNQIDGMYTKVCQGVTGVQKYFDYRYRQCKALNIPIGFYFWLSSWSLPEAQAEKFVQLTQGYDTDFEDMIDIEDIGERWDEISAEEYATRFIDKYRELTGRTPIIYSGEYFVKNTFSESFCNKYYWWIAKYYNDRTDNHPVPYIQKCGDTTIWQFSDQGTLSGVSGYVDLDNVYDTDHVFKSEQHSSSTSDKPKVPSNPDFNGIISLGQQHAHNFCGVNLDYDGVRGPQTRKAAIKVLQHALNLDYNSGLVEDGIFGPATQRAMYKANGKSHTVVLGETQYMVTALEIMLMLKGYNPEGVECPGTFGDNLHSCLLQYQEDMGLSKDGIAGIVTFKSLMQ